MALFGWVKQMAGRSRRHRRHYIYGTHDILNVPPLFCAVLGTFCLLLLSYPLEIWNYFVRMASLLFHLSLCVGMRFVWESIAKARLLHLMFSLWLRTVGKEEGFFFLFYRAGMIFEKMPAKTCFARQVNRPSSLPTELSQTDNVN